VDAVARAGDSQAAISPRAVGYRNVAHPDEVAAGGALERVDQRCVGSKPGPDELLGGRARGARSRPRAGSTFIPAAEAVGETGERKRGVAGDEAVVDVAATLLLGIGVDAE